LVRTQYQGGFAIKHTVEYETMAEPGAVIDGTAIEDLKGWPISHSFDLPARDDADAIRITKDWYPGMSSYLNSIHRYMVGEPRLLKTVTIDWKT